MNKRFGVIIGISSVFVLFSFLLTSPRAEVSAEENISSGLQLYPSSARFSLDPSDNVKRNIEVTNLGQTKIDFEVSARPYTVISPTYTPVFSDENYYTQIADWVEFKQKNYTIEPNQKINVSFNINVPDDPPQGGQYAVIFITTKPTNDENTALQRVDRLTHILYTRVNGDTREESKIAWADFPWLAVERGEMDDGRVKSSSNVVNDGNVDIDVTQRLTVSSLFFGQKVYENEERKIVLPETNRDLSLDWPDQPYFGIYRGNYTVETPNETVNKFVILVIGPQWLLLTLGGILGLASLILIIFLIRKVAKKNKL